MLSMVLLIEELCRVDPGIGLNIFARDFGAEYINKFGTEEQKRRYLPPLAAGKAISGTAITEPEHGSDVAGLQTQAKKKKGYYELTGRKMFITNGSIANFLVVLARTRAEAQRRDGLSAFIVDCDSPGVSSHKLRGKTGLNASDLAEVVLERTRVPEENLLGQIHRGFYHLMDFFAYGRTKVAAQAVGTAQGAFDEAFRYAKERTQFGKPIVEFQAIRMKLAEMATEIEAARLLTRQAAVGIDEGHNVLKLSSMAKYFASDVAERQTSEAVQIHGGYGYMREYAVERFYRSSKITQIYEGTNEIQKIVIARELLKEDS